MIPATLFGIDWNTINGVLRAVLPVTFAWMVSKGWIGAGSVADLITMEMAFVAAAWSVYSNSQAATLARAAAITATPVVTK
jgi:hypothetical protein